MGTRPHKKLHYGTKDHTLKCTVVGLNYRVTVGEQYELAKSVPQYALLEREPSNMYDGNAIQVKMMGDRHIGYIPKDVAASLAPKLDSGDIQIVSVRVIEIDPDTGVGQLSIIFRKKIRNHP